MSHSYGLEKNKKAPAGRTGSCKLVNFIKLQVTDHKIFEQSSGGIEIQERTFPTASPVQTLNLCNLLP